MPRRTLLLMVTVLVVCAGCYPVVTPDIRGDVRFAITNETGRMIQVRTTAEGQGISSEGETLVAPDEAAEIIVPLTAQWAIWVDRVPFLNSQGRPDLSPPPGRDLLIEITVDGNGPRVTDTSFVAPNPAS